MSEHIRSKFEIPATHTLKEVSMNWKGAHKGRDDDEYLFNQLDENDNVVASYTEIHSTSTYPPFATSIRVTKN